MSTSAVRWRPLGDTDLDWVKQAVQEALEQWQGDWFERPAFAVTSVSRHHPGNPYTADNWTDHWQVGAHLSMHTNRSAWSHYAAALLGLVDARDLAEVAALLTPLQNNLLESLVSQLSTRLHSVEGVHEPVHAPTCMHAMPHGGLLLSLGTAHTPDLLRVCCASELVWARPLPRSVPNTRGSEPESYVTALNDSHVSVCVLLDHVELTALQLAELAVGDVLATSRLLTAPVDVRLLSNAASPYRFAQGRLGRTGQRISIELTSFPTSQLP